MGVSQAEKAKSRDRILTAAARQIREGGLESVSIGKLMKAAQLTHGAFYAHFGSRADLLAAALDRALAEGVVASHSAIEAKGPRTMKTTVNSYLSAAHRDNPANGCAVASLVADAARGDDAVQAIMRERVESFITDTATMIGDGPVARAKAIASWSTMVGAMMLSRLFRDDALSDEILRDARMAVLDWTAPGDTAE